MHRRAYLLPQTLYRDDERELFPLTPHIVFRCMVIRANTFPMLYGAADHGSSPERKGATESSVSLLYIRCLEVGKGLALSQSAVAFTVVIDRFLCLFD